ncbi:MAG: DUF4270 domain-containing protein [Bacteroidetes bacterium]|nr:DUF4270 domain-containing protein [Bacteroidota bacterium]
MRLRLLIPLIALVVSVAACDDAPGVGLDLVRGEGLVPSGHRELVDSVNTTNGVDFTAGSSGSATTTPQRVLGGIVHDPSLGTVTATPAVEFGNPTGTNLDGFRGKAVSSATLTIPIKRGYYGDTTAAVTFELRSLARELTTISIRSDSVLATSDVVTTVTAGPRDTVLTVVLPAAWVAANDARLRATTALDSLHGFVLAPLSGGQIRSIPFGSAVLTAVAGSDTARFAGTIGATRVARTGTPTLGSDVTLLQDGFPMRMTVPFDTSGIPSEAMARASLVLTYDTTRLVTPAGFVRPSPPRLTLVGMDAAGTTLLYNGVLFGQAVPSKGKVVFTSEALRRVFQDRRMGRSNDLARLAVQFADFDAGLAALVVPTGSVTRPYYVFTTVSY